MRLFLLVFAFLPTLAIGAAIEDDDFKLVRSLMRPGQDILGLQQQIIIGTSELKDWWHDAKRSSLLVHDLNGDGLKDVVMAVEENPKIQGEKDALCDAPVRISGRKFCWGERAIEVHYQQPDGSYHLGARSSNLMMTVDEVAGVVFDPFDGFTLTTKGSIRVTFSFGTGLTGEYNYTLQFRKDDVYVIGAYESSCNYQLECITTDANLLTGQWWIENSTGDGKHQKTKGVLKTMRPWRLKYAFVGMDPCIAPPKTENGNGGVCDDQAGFSCNDDNFDICRDR